MTASKAAREFPRGLESGIDALVLSRIDVLVDLISHCFCHYASSEEALLTVLCM
jgi:hypothetical protein